MSARLNQVQRIVRLVTEGSSVEIVGTRWSGRTELLRRAHQALSSIGLTVITVRGIGNGLPLEAIRVALPVAPGPPRAETMSASGLINRFVALAGEGPSVVILDDGDLLDDASWAVLETVHKRAGTPMVAVTLQRAGVAPADHLLIKIAHPVVKIALHELTLEDVQRLLEDRLAGPVAPSASGRIHTKSGGIPGFALAIADAAVSSGQLRVHGAVWRDEPDLWSEDLNGAYEALLFSYPNDIREALEVLALVGAVPVPQAAELVGQPMVELVEGHGLAKLFAAGDRHMITVNPPGIGDYFRNLPLSSHRLRLLSHIEDTLGRSVQTPVPAIPTQRTLMSTIGQPELPLVARMFSEAYAVDLALAWHDWEMNPTVAAAARVLGLQLTGTTFDDQLWQVVEHTEVRDASPEAELEFRFLHARWLTVNERPFSEVAAVMTPRPDFPHRKALSGLLTALEMERTGIPDDYAAKLEDSVDAAGLDGEVARVVLAALHVFAGHGDEAIPLLEGVSSPFIQRFADMMHGLALFSSGKPAEAVEWASAHVAVAVNDGDRPALAAHSYVAALSLLSLGRFDDASEAGNIVTSAGVSAARLLFAPDRALMLTLAMAATRTGRTLAAEAFLERGERYLGRSDALPLGTPGMIEAATIAAEGELASAARHYFAIADDLDGRGFVLASDGARLLGILTDFDAATATEFRPAANRMGGALFTGYLDAREASQQEDPVALRAAARLLREQNATDEALKHLTYTATLYRDQGKLDEASDVRSEIRALMSLEGAVTVRGASRAESSWGLTAREREIIDDVSAGRSNIDIAARHGISVRTIETHMRNIRRKTGAVNRDEIASFGAAGDVERARR
ncbi:hypothetical protein HCX50_04010 [Microbacterium oxydans]|uniref:LuxR C-terminal-related transcriptional regulator n=1 Tax=Microbacterium sp. B19(2022) TaxID=2914045 RepID=UPI00142F6C02|nr:hypothetical protein [Microbacterium sp. B19(2022)]